MLDLLAGMAATGWGDRFLLRAGAQVRQDFQVAKRRASWTWSGSVMSARWLTSHRSNEQICLSTVGSTPQDISRSRR